MYQEKGKINPKRGRERPILKKEHLRQTELLQLLLFVIRDRCTSSIDLFKDTLQREEREEEQVLQLVRFKPTTSLSRGICSTAVTLLLTMKLQTLGITVNS